MDLDDILIRHKIAIERLEAALEVGREDTSLCIFLVKEALEILKGGNDETEGVFPKSV